MPPASVAHAYQALVRTVEQDDMLGVRQPVNAFEAMHGAAFLRNEAFFAPDLLPPVLLHPSGQPNANWLYGRTRASPLADAAYKPGKFDLFGKRRHDAHADWGGDHAVQRASSPSRRCSTAGARGAHDPGGARLLGAARAA